MKERKQPQRTCVGCREEKDKKDLIRIVHTPEDEYLVDPGGKAAGRGAYLCRSAECPSEPMCRKRRRKSFGRR